VEKRAVKNARKLPTENLSISINLFPAKILRVEWLAVLWIQEDKNDPEK
jgi:hypothetical protein